MFHALADPTRRRIVEKLSRAEHGVMELAAEFSMSQPAVTKHLNVLQKAGIIARHKEGRRRVCRLKPRALEGSARWIERCRDFWNARHQRFGAVERSGPARERKPGLAEAAL